MTSKGLNIVVLDGYASNPGDLSWKAFEAIGEVTVYERTPEELTVERSLDADIVLTNKAKLSAEILDQLPKLKYIGILATGTNIVDLEHARKRNIAVTNVPGYSTDAVAQHVFAMMLNFSSRVADHDTSVHRGNWVNCKDFSYTLGPIHELSGKKIGIIGLGTIGRKIAEIANCFGMEIIAAHQSSMNRLELPYRVSWLPVDEVFQQADFISLNCPLTDATDSLVNEERLASMKSSAYLINTGRGPLIDEAALAKALNNHVLAGAALDVLCQEPPAKNNPLLTAKNCVLTPHIAWASVEARGRLLQIASSNIKAFLKDKKENLVN